MWPSAQSWRSNLITQRPPLTFIVVCPFQSMGRMMDNAFDSLDCWRAGQWSWYTLSLFAKRSAQSRLSPSTCPLKDWRITVQLTILWTVIGLHSLIQWRTIDFIINPQSIHITRPSIHCTFSKHANACFSRNNIFVNTHVCTHRPSRSNFEKKLFYVCDLFLSVMGYCYVMLVCGYENIKMLIHIIRVSRIVITYCPPSQSRFE